MLPYNTKDLSVTEHGELVGLLEQAVAARPAGCRAACRRRPAGCRARVGDAAPAPAGGRRCGRARAGPGKTRGCDGDCGAGGRAEIRASSRRPRPRVRLRWGLRRGRAGGRPQLGLLRVLRVWRVPSFVHGLQWVVQC